MGDIADELYTIKWTSFNGSEFAEKTRFFFHESACSPIRFVSTIGAMLVPVPQHRAPSVQHSVVHPVCTNPWCTQCARVLGAPSAHDFAVHSVCRTFNVHQAFTTVRCTKCPRFRSAPSIHEWVVQPMCTTDSVVHPVCTTLRCTRLPRLRRTFSLTRSSAFNLTVARQNISYRSHENL